MGIVGRRSLAVFLALVALVAVALVPGIAPASTSAQYVAGGTAVEKDAGAAATVDNGAVVCHSSTGNGIGGACLSFGGGVGGLDAGVGAALAFQVCIDNNGDGICQQSRESGFGCGDDLFFSHDDKGGFFNPLGPLPGGFRPGCPGGAWNGYVVFLCTGVHNAGLLHTHEATTGTVTTTTSGIGFGDFCGGGVQAAAKRYAVLP